MPKKTTAQKEARRGAMEQANRGAAEVPLAVLRRCLEVLPFVRAVAERGNPASLSDAGVAALSVGTAAEGAYLNVRINLPQIEDEGFRAAARDEADRLAAEAREAVEGIRQKVLEQLQD